MKIFGNLRGMEDTLSLLKRIIPEQVKETVEMIDLGGDYYDSEGMFVGESGIFPFFIQQDKNARYVWNSKGDKRIVIRYPEYDLLFLWEPSDLKVYYDEEDVDEDLDKDVVNRYITFLNKAGIRKIEDITIPTKFVYLGSIEQGNEESLSLPGIVYAEDHPDNSGDIGVLDDCMFDVCKYSFSLSESDSLHLEFTKTVIDNSAVRCPHEEISK